MSHYYINDPSLKSDIKIITYTYKNNLLSLTTDAGVFSKDRVDFGTNVLINALNEDFSDKRVLDIGCGYGIVGIAIAKAYPTSIVEMADVNDKAIELAKINAIDNKVDNVKVYCSNLFEGVDSSFDVIISNPPVRAGKTIVHGIITEGYKHLNLGGSIWIVIQKKQGAESLMRKMEEIFSNLNVVQKDKGYYILKSVKV